MVQALLGGAAYINGCAADTFAWGAMLRGGAPHLPPGLCTAFQQVLLEAFADPCPPTLALLVARVLIITLEYGVAS